VISATRPNIQQLARDAIEDLGLAALHYLAADDGAEHYEEPLPA
jgi:hypothetical protein